MAWTTPRTWTTGELVTKTIMDTHVRDNLNFLKDPPSAYHTVNEASDYTTTSTSFVNVDATDLSLTILCTGGDVLLTFYGSLRNASQGARVYFDVLEGASNRLGGDDGLIYVMPKQDATYNETSVCFAFLKTGLSSGYHTFRLQWKVSAGTATLYAGAGTSGQDVHPQFLAREIT